MKESSNWYDEFRLLVFHTQVYLKLQSSCLLFSNESSRCDRASVDATVAVGMGMGHKYKEESDQDSDEDEMWNGMETVGGRRTQSKREFQYTHVKFLIIT